MARLADAANEFKHAGERSARLKSAFRGALDGGAVGERVAEGNAEFDDVGAGFGEGEDEREGGVKGRIASGDVGDDAEFAGVAKSGEALGDASGTLAVMAGGLNLSKPCGRCPCPYRRGRRD